MPLQFRRIPLASLLALTALVITSCAPGAQPYTGVAPRTPLDKISGNGDLKNFTLVGQNPLIDPQFNLPRGMNGGITAVRDCLYVGSNIGLQPALVLDMKDMTKPTVVGELPGIKGRGNGIEAIEAVADLNLLVNTVRNTFTIQGTAIGFDPPAADKNVGLLIYDTTDCRKPTLAGKFSFPNTNLHYMTLWRDPNRNDRVLAAVTFSSGDPKDGIDIRVVDLTGCPKSCNPKQVAEWGLRAQYNIPPTVETTYQGGTNRWGTQTHDVTFSIDGKTMYAAQQQFGMLVLDSTPLATGQSCNPASANAPYATGNCIRVLNPDLSQRVLPFGTVNATVHGVVKIPGKPYVSLQHEGHACPYGGITIAYIGNTESFQPGSPGTGLIRGDLFPRVVGRFGLPEQEVDRCPQPGQPIPPTTNGLTGTLGADMLRTSKTIHNVLALPDVLFATWYGGGLRAVDISNPYSPFEVGYFFNKPAAEVRWCGEETAIIQSCQKPEIDAEGVPVRARQLNPPDVFARSYPIIMNGHVVYSDENMGVYVLKYTGPHADQIPSSGLCISHNPNVVKAGFEPCPPYK